MSNNVFGESKIPTMGRIVHYRGKLGLQAMRMAFVACTKKELLGDDEQYKLDSPMHVHLQVVTIGTQMMFPENNVPYAFPDNNGEIPPGHWTWPVMV